MSFLQVTWKDHPSVEVTKNTQIGHSQEPGTRFLWYVYPFVKGEGEFLVLFDLRIFWPTNDFLSWSYYFPRGLEMLKGTLVRPSYTLWKINMEPNSHPIEKEISSAKSSF